MSRDIIFVTISLSNMAGGLERNIISIANYLSCSRRVHLVSFDWSNAQSFYDISQTVTWHKIATSEPHKPISFGNRIRLLLNLRRIIKDAGNPIIIVFHHGILVRILLAGLGLRASVLVSERNSLSLYKHIAAKKWNLNFLALHFAQKVIVQFPAFKLDYPISLRRKIVCIPNAVSRGSAASEVHKSVESHHRHQILSVGRLCAQKRFDHLILAFARIAQAHSGWRLTIVGDGEKRTEITDLVRRLGLSNRIDIVPASHSIVDYYRQADIFCTTSKWEGFPNAMAEAMAMGIACVGYVDCEGVNQLIKDGDNGCLVDRDVSHGKLAKCLDTLILDDGLRYRLGKEATDCMEQYHPEIILPKWRALIDAV